MLLYTKVRPKNSGFIRSGDNAYSPVMEQIHDNQGLMVISMHLIRTINCNLFSKGCIMIKM